MTLATKLRVHLEFIVSPEGVALNARQTDELCDAATFEQRYEAFKHGQEHVPFILPEEIPEAIKWLRPCAS